MLILRRTATTTGLVCAVLGLLATCGCLTLSTTEGAGAGGSGATASSSSGSSGGECSSVEDCPNVTYCNTMKCTEHKCVAGFVEAGLGCMGDKVCDGQGTCVECVNSNDCESQNGTCVNNQCVSCSDGQQNGDETGVDCGGSKCSPCAMTCSNNNDCMSGFCVDGVCCDAACTAACKSCNIAGKVGKCSSLSKGTEDPGVCESTKACSGFSAQCLLKDGQPCMSDGQCLSDYCSAGNNLCAP